MHTNIIKTQNPQTISARHIHQLVKLTMSTGYFQYMLLSNNLGQDVDTVIEIKYVRPYLQQTKVILDDLENIAGFYVGLTKKQRDIAYEPSHWHRRDADTELLVAHFNGLSSEIGADDYYLRSLAVRYDLHGLIYPTYERKIVDLLFEDIFIDAHNVKSSSIMLKVWESHQAAVKLYKRYGGKIVQIADVSHLVFADKLYLIQIPISGGSM